MVLESQPIRSGGGDRVSDPAVPPSGASFPGQFPLGQGLRSRVGTVELAWSPVSLSTNACSYNRKLISRSGAFETLEKEKAGMYYSIN